jgi:hypothetical protein
MQMRGLAVDGGDQQASAAVCIMSPPFLLCAVG